MRIGAWRRKRCAEPLCRRGLPCGAAVPPCGLPRALPCGSPLALPCALPHGICPCVAPPFRCGSVCAGALFHAGGGIALRGRAFCIPGAEPGRRLQPQQKRYPAGGLALFAVCRPRLSGSRKGGVPFFSPPYPAFSFLYCPHPPSPLPRRGRGRLKVYFAGGYRPRHPCIRPPAALARPAAVVLNGGACPCAALAIPAPGERTISNAEVPLPRSPLSLAAGTANREPLPIVFAANRGFKPQGCKGRSPLHKIT